MPDQPHTEGRGSTRAPVGRLTGFEYGVLERPDSCLWTADQEAMKKAAKRLRWLEAERKANR